MIESLSRMRNRKFSRFTKPFGPIARNRYFPVSRTGLCPPANRQRDAFLDFKATASQLYQGDLHSMR